ncbi:MAG: hypothetical protein AAF639_30060 [Chloroflexota bacterium]
MGRARILILILFLLGIFGVTAWIAFTYVPVFVGQALAVFEPGLGLQQSAIIGFILTVAVLTLFALVADAGILGELEVLLGSFFTFFFIFTGLIAWLF